MFEIEQQDASICLLLIGRWQHHLASRRILIRVKILFILVVNSKPTFLSFSDVVFLIFLRLNLRGMNQSGGRQNQWKEKDPNDITLDDHDEGSKATSTEPFNFHAKRS